MRILALWAFVLLALSMRAQADSDKALPKKDPFYLQLYGGINKSANENLPWSETTKYPWSYGAFVGLGYEFSPLWGVRTALRLNHNKSRNVQTCESNDVWGWNNLALFVDGTFDVTDALKLTPKSGMHCLNLKAFAGVGGAFTWGFDRVPLSYTEPYSRESQLVPAARVGLTLTYRFARRWRIGVEASHTWYEDHFNGVAAETPIDGRSNLKIGLTYLFVKRKKKPARQVARLNRLKEMPEAVAMAMPAPETNKMRKIEGHAFLDFPVNETIIYPKYRKNPDELARIHKSVDSAMFDKTIVIKRISLHGYASPESPWSNNVRLAKGRTEELKNYLIGKYHFKPEVFATTFTPEDWGNLRGFLMNTSERKVKDSFWYDSQAFVETPEVPNIVLNYRDELVEVIDRDMEPDAKEEVLKAVGGGQPYRWLHRHVYPGLRHTDYIIEYEVKPYPVKDGRKLIYTHPEALSLEEMCKVAESYEEGSDNWMDVLLIAARQYPDNELANYNAAYGCAKTKRLNDAKKYLRKAGNNQNAQALSDAIKAMEGRVSWELNNGKLTIFE